MQCTVIAINGCSKGKIGQRIFMGAVDVGGIGQTGQTLQAVPHLGITALENAAAAGTKQRITTKQRIIDNDGHVSDRVTRDIDDGDIQAGYGGWGCFRNPIVDAGNAFGIAGMADDAAAKGLFECQIGAGMIPVMMSIDDMRGMEVMLLTGMQYRIGLGRIDNETGGMLSDLNDIDIIIFQCRQLVNAEVLMIMAPHGGMVVEQRRPCHAAAAAGDACGCGLLTSWLRSLCFRASHHWATQGRYGKEMIKRG